MASAAGDHDAITHAWNLSADINRLLMLNHGNVVTANFDFAAEVKSQGLGQCVEAIVGMVCHDAVLVREFMCKVGVSPSLHSQFV